MTTVGDLFASFFFTFNCGYGEKNIMCCRIELLFPFLLCSLNPPIHLLLKHGDNNLCRYSGSRLGQNQQRRHIQYQNAKEVFSEQYY